jgi:hypothetical protein
MVVHAGERRFVPPCDVSPHLAAIEACFRRQVLAADVDLP